MSKRYLIRTKRHFFRGILAAILNLVMWIYVLVTVMLFVSAIFDFNTNGLRILKSIMKVNNDGIRMFMFTSLLWFLASFIVLWLWKQYNYKRYGSLDRRQYPSQTTMDEILELNLVPADICIQMQNSKVTILETSPVRDINAEEEVA